MQSASMSAAPYDDDVPGTPPSKQIGIFSAYYYTILMQAFLKEKIWCRSADIDTKSKRPKDGQKCHL